MRRDNLGAFGNVSRLHGAPADSHSQSRHKLYKTFHRANKKLVFITSLKHACLWRSRRGGALAVGAAQYGTKFLRVVLKVGEKVASFFLAAPIVGADFGVSGNQFRSNL